MNKLTAIRNKSASRRGFSLAEVLIVLAILAILMALLIPNLVKRQRELRQKELDAKAEIIYVAVQNQLSKLRASGNADKYQPGEKVLAIPTPSDSASLVARDFYYFTSRNTDILPAGLIDTGTLPGSFVVEFVYDAKNQSAYVYSVFYSEGSSNDVAANYSASSMSTYNGLRNYNARLKNGAHLGYYGGDVGSSASNTAASGTVLAGLIPENGEKLTVHLQCTLPREVQSPASANVTFTFVVKDAINGKTVRQVFTTADGEVKNPTGGRSFSKDVVLDDLSSGTTRFGDENSIYRKAGIVPGHDLLLSLTVECDNTMDSDGTNLNLAPALAEGRVNSLFDDDTVYNSTTKKIKAVISCGRHLQNLGSAAATSVTEAELETEINFLSTKSDGWISTYGGTGEGSNNYYNSKDGAATRTLSPSRMRT